MGRYRYRDDIAIADAAFEAWGDTFEDLCRAAANALMNVMVNNLQSIRDSVRRTIHVEADSDDMLLFHLLEELIFYKDAESLLLRIDSASVKRCGDLLSLDASVYGETIDPSRHDLNVDVKAVTIYRYDVERTAEGWKATVVLDV